ncbi:hypothetical protein [Notoacmeibacter sp. MSK16QG-6]|uniref:hypothetical protein n=1 Tax=Notoacmeibacter sp. MSK16QG-6 TaxID=2957982 RepID=UPI00209EC6B6|nr:hypothetical protein [Notoacmeibacter sp. MSK16QG-6]MCP1198869.1 hypothetical protein [Notoacmeibacter sp. MSK16QG-6]
MAGETRQMLERKGERQTRLETAESFGIPNSLDQAGTSGGQPAKKTAKEDDEKRSFEQPAGATRVTKGDEAE